MKRYAFRLEKVLHYREHMEKLEQRRLFNALHRCKLIRQEIENLTGEKMRVAQSLGDKGSLGISVAEYRIFVTYLQGIDKVINDAVNRLKHEEEVVLERRESLKKASIKKKTLESLKDLHRQMYKEELDRDEQKQIDELVLIRKGIGS